MSEFRADLIISLDRIPDEKTGDTEKGRAKRRTTNGKDERALAKFGTKSSILSANRRW
jgi:hypothetical protein